MLFHQQQTISGRSLFTVAAATLALPLMLAMSLSKYGYKFGKSSNVPVLPNVAKGSGLGEGIDSTVRDPGEQTRSCRHPPRRRPARRKKARPPGNKMMSNSQPQTIITVTFTAAAATALAVATTLALSNSRRRHSDSSSSSSPASSSSSSSANNNKFQIPRALLNSPYASALKLAVRLALQAGRNMYSYCDAAGTAGALSQQLDTTIKGDRPEDFCTQIDVENERNIMAAIQSHFPTHNIIGEETVGDGEIPPLSNDIPTWIIDRTYCLIALISLSLF
jgi:Inositol monophosphatase family